MKEDSVREIMDKRGVSAWDRFFISHGEPKFFKERRYLTFEFLCLQQESPPIKIIDLGSGYGSSILPILKAPFTSGVYCLSFCVSFVGKQNMLVSSY